MKRFFCIIICLLLLSGCGTGKENIKVPANFYYLQNQSSSENPAGGILPEIRDCCDCNGDLKDLVEHYLSGPQSPDLYSPFPLGTSVRAVFMEDSTLCVELNGIYSTLKGYSLTIANGCLAKTLMDYTGASAVRISSENTDLVTGYTITLREADLLFFDTAAQTTGG